ncbi:MAG: hypothetical protein JWN11_2401 [Hyphomicrobiales bacterium]|nr:hypothetical protein [Hyphomicrobiales bacterium]
MRVEETNKTTTEVRQADHRKMNFTVLLLSLVGIIVLFALVYFIFAMQPHPTAP